MIVFDEMEVEKILLQLEERGIFALKHPYKLCRENGHLCLLGTGSTAYVYEVYDNLAPENRYALKVLGFHGEDLDVRGIYDSSALQAAFSKYSENIVKAPWVWSMKLSFDEEGKLKKIYRVEEECREETLLLQMILLEKLENILYKDRFGNVELLRPELKTEGEVLVFAQQIGQALAFVHQNHCLHRDIKLENVFWDSKAGVYKLGDFGVARYVDNGMAETVLFTNGYGAPEIEKRLRESYDVTADIYSFGMMLYVLLNDLKFPMSEYYRARLIQYEKDFSLPAPVHASKTMARILRKMCSYEPEDRYQSVEEVLAEFYDPKISSEANIESDYAEEGIQTEIYREEVETPLDQEEDVTTEIFQGEKESEISEEEVENNKGNFEKEQTKKSKISPIMTYEERKKLYQKTEAKYLEMGIRVFFLSSLLFLCIIEFFRGVDEGFLEWSYWLFPFVLAMESLLQRLKIFHRQFTFITLIFSIYSFIYLNTPMVSGLAIFVSLLGLSSVTAALALGSWISINICSWYGLGIWFEALNKWDLGWIYILALFMLIDQYVFQRDIGNRGCSTLEYLVMLFMHIFGLLAIPLGIVCLILDNFHILEIPNFLNSVHLIRLGLGIFILQNLCGEKDKYYKDSFKELKQVMKAGIDGNLDRRRD